MIDWDEIPEIFNFVAMDSDQNQFTYENHPNVGRTTWLACGGEAELLDLDISGMDIDIPWRASLHQRPGTWDGILRRYDNVLLEDGHQGYLDLCNAPDGLWDIMQEDGTPWTLFRSDKVLAVNHTLIDAVPKKKHQKIKRLIGLPAEVHNDQPIDVEKALAAIHDLCRGHK